jgi:hypothetical protein
MIDKEGHGLALPLAGPRDSAAAAKGPQGVLGGSAGVLLRTVVSHAPPQRLASERQSESAAARIHVVQRQAEQPPIDVPPRASPYRHVPATDAEYRQNLRSTCGKKILRPPRRPGKVASDLLCNGRDGRI